jgi:single-stranded-DNA-specific exonuclease
MVRFGGHRAAAGFTARNEMLPALREALVAHATDCLRGLELTPVIDIDAAIPLNRVNGSLIEQLMQLGPFGQANPDPTFLSRDVEVAEAKIAGADGTHLRLRLRAQTGARPGVTWPAIAFGQAPADDAPQISPGDRLDVVYTFSADRNGNGGLELRVQDFAPAQAPEDRS